MLGREWLDTAENERKPVDTHPSKWVVFKQVFASTCMIALIIGLSLQDFATDILIGQLQLRTVLLFWIPVALLLPVAAEIKRRSTHYVITDNNIWAKKKIFARDVDPTVRSRVQDVSYSQSYLDRLLNKGDVKIETAGTGEIDTVLRDIPDPQGATMLIREGIEDADKAYRSMNI